ncbi:MAG: hypothetical protein R2786_04895 [Flavobacteriaceae bacterium]
MEKEDKINVQLSPIAALKIYTFLNHFIEKSVLIDKFQMKAPFDDFEKELINKMSDKQCLDAIKSFKNNIINK